MNAPDNYLGLCAQAYAAGRSAADGVPGGYAVTCTTCGAPLFDDEEDRGTCAVCAAGRCPSCRGRGRRGGLHVVTRPCGLCGGRGTATTEPVE